jgi:hypothetical protein
VRSTLLYSKVHLDSHMIAHTVLLCGWQSRILIEDTALNSLKRASSIHADARDHFANYHFARRIVVTYCVELALSFGPVVLSIRPIGKRILFERFEFADHYHRASPIYEQRYDSLSRSKCFLGASLCLTTSGRAECVTICLLSQVRASGQRASPSQCAAQTSRSRR